MSINYRSGNIGFAVTIIMCVIFLAKLELEGNHDFEFFATTIVVGLAAKGLFNVLLVKSYRDAGSKIIIGVGLLLGLFASLDQGSVVGILLNLLGGGVIAGIGLLAKKYPLPIGIITLVIAGLLLLLILTVGLANSKSLFTQLLVALIVGGPLITAAICLLIGSKGTVEA
jgi:hypothetical protein